MSVSTLRPGRGFLWGAGAAELGLLAAVGWWPGLPFPLPGLPLLGGAFLACLAGAWSVGSGGRDDAWVLWAFGVAFRLVLLPLSPELSDDVYRYLWDGHLQLRGVNPYGAAPADPALEPLRTPFHGLVNHPEVPTIYPPLAQYAFAAIALAGGGVLRAKLLWVLLDLVAAWLLVRVARAGGRNTAPVLVLYLWSPLLVVEVAWNAHLEPLGLAAMALLLAVAPGAGAVSDGRAPPPDPSREEGHAALPRVAGAWAVGAATGLAALVKFAPAAALPALVRRFGPRVLVSFGAAVGALYLPFLEAGEALWRGLGIYARDWRANEGAFLLLEEVLGGGWPPRIAAAAGVLAVVAWTAWRRYGAERALFWILGAGILLSPTVHPWYVLWMLPFAALRRSPPWILLSGLAFLGYWGLGDYRSTGVWTRPDALPWLLWGPVLFLLAREALRLRRTSRTRLQQTSDRKAEIPGREEPDEG